MSLRPTALTMPAVTVEESWKGLPHASTHSPTSRWSELPSSAAVMFFASILITATSLFSSRPMSSALKVRPSSSTTSSSSALATTWLFVRM